MKITNYSNDQITLELAGAVSSAAAASTGLIDVTDGVTTIGPVTSIEFDGGSVTDLGDGAVSVDISGGVPYYIPVDTTFTVPLYKQLLFAEMVDNLGIIDVIGHLIEVD